MSEPDMSELRELKKASKRDGTKAAVALLALGGLLVVGLTGDSKPSDSASTASSDSPSSSAAGPIPTMPSVPDDPDVDDFAIDLVVTEDECFGSAGGLTTVEPDITYNGPGFSGSHRLIYRITGGEDGTVTDTIQVHEDGNYEYSAQVVGTKTCNATLSARPVGLR